MPIRAIVTLNDVVPFLGMSDVPSDNGLKLQGFVDAATAVVEDIVGHVIWRQFAETYDGGDSVLYLRHTPVISVESIREIIGLVGYDIRPQPVGQPVDNFGYTLDNLTVGLVTRRGAGSNPTKFYRNTNNITVRYTAGRPSVPPNIRNGTLELIREWWQFGQPGYTTANAYAPSPSAADMEGGGHAAPDYAVSPRIKELLIPGSRDPILA